MSYYKQIEGVKYDRELVEAADEAVAGRGDGRISRADAEKLLAFVTDGGRMTDVEQATIVYLRANYKWTEKGENWFMDALADWQATGALPQTPQPAEDDDRPVAVIARIGASFKTSRYFAADIAAQAQGGAVLIRGRGPDAPAATEIWKHTEAHKASDLPDDVEKALCRSCNGILRANVWSFASYLGTQNGQILAQYGFTNVTTDVLIAALEAVGYQVVDADTFV